MVFKILLELIFVHKQRLLFIFVFLQVGLFWPRERVRLAPFCGCVRILQWSQKIHLPPTDS